MSEFTEDTPVEPTGDTEAAPEADAPEQAGFNYEAPEFQDAIRDTLRGELGTALQDLFAQQQPEEGPDLNLYGEPDEVQQGLRELIQHEIRGAMEPILPTVHEFQDQQSQQQIAGMIEKIPAAAEAQGYLGEDAAPNEAATAIEYMANGFLPDTEGRYGQGARAVETALRMAADKYNAALKAAHAAGYQARNAELTRRSDTREPVPAGAVEGVQIREAPRDIFEAADRIAARYESA